ncbi:uncharacterized protein LOC134723629 [Mytilus trossulus]|uniref:uncharacterized protein LOC134723629 n=1 Tax=Mytilus trossulus TaxID=6551 RepID=UPI003005502E
MTLVFNYILFVLVPMILNQLYVDAYTYGMQCVECDDDRKERFCRESTDDNGQTSFTAFTFTLDHNTIKWKKGDIVKYTRKLTDIGNCYNPNTGIFTVKTNGVYAVSAAMIGGPKQSTHYSLRKNGEQMVWLFTGPTYDMSAQTINLILKKGDRLWIQLEWLPVHIFHIKHPYHQFSAILIKAGTF